MLVFLNLLLLGVGSQAAPQPQLGLNSSRGIQSLCILPDQNMSLASLGENDYYRSENRDDETVIYLSLCHPLRNLPPTVRGLCDENAFSCITKLNVTTEKETEHQRNAGRATEPPFLSRDGGHIQLVFKDGGKCVDPITNSTGYSTFIDFFCDTDVAPDNAIRYEGKFGNCASQVFWHTSFACPPPSQDKSSHLDEAQDDCVYVDEEVCHTMQQEVCEDVWSGEWECRNATRFVEGGVDVEVCNPTTRNVCTPKTRYEPEEYEEEDCTTATEEVCIWNYDTVVKKHNVTECREHQMKECFQVPGPPTVITREELRCTCDICTTVYEECTPRNCDKYNKNCEKCPTQKCHKGPTQHTRSGCDNPECKTVEIQTEKKSPPVEHCVTIPAEYCSEVERDKAVVVKRKECNHVPETKCVTVTKTRQKEIPYQECLEHTERVCKTITNYEITKPETFELCTAVTKENCSFKPMKICKTIQVQICGGH